MKGFALLPPLALALACADYTPAEPPRAPSAPGVAAASSSLPHGMVPFKYKGEARTVGEPWLGCGGEPTNTAIPAAGFGNATHLGNFTWTYYNCWTSAFEWVEQRGVMTAANGDLVHWYGSVADGSVMTLDWASLTYSATSFWIVGGTGRFEGATGMFDFHGAFSADATWADGIAEGYISAIGSIIH